MLRHWLVGCHKFKVTAGYHSKGTMGLYRLRCVHCGQEVQSGTGMD